MNQANRNAIYNGVNIFTGLPGAWEDQRGAPTIKGPHFTLKLLYPGVPIQRKGSPSFEDPNRVKWLTRLRSTLRIKVFNGDGISNIVDSTGFHNALNDGGVVCNALEATADFSFAYPERERVEAYDLIITWTMEIPAQDEEPTDDWIDSVTINSEEIP